MNLKKIHIKVNHEKILGHPNKREALRAHKRSEIRMTWQHIHLENGLMPTTSKRTWLSPRIAYSETIKQTWGYNENIFKHSRQQKFGLLFIFPYEATDGYAPSIRVKAQRKIQGPENGESQTGDYGIPLSAGGKLQGYTVRQGQTTISAGCSRMTPRDC